MGVRRKIAAGILYPAAGLLFLLALAWTGGGPATTMVIKLLLGAGGAAAIIGAGVILAHGRPEKRGKIVRVTIWLLFCLYLLVLLFLLFGNGFSGRTNWAFRDLAARWKQGVNWRPFTTIWSYLNWAEWDMGALSQAAVNIGGNLAAFAPCGVFLPLLFRRLRRFWAFFLAMTAAIVLVELIQLATGTGVCDIDDLILNLAGAAAVYGLAHIPPVRRWAARLVKA